MGISSAFYPDLSGRDPVCVLTVLSDPDERARLTQILRHSTWIVHSANCFEQAGRILKASPVGVVIAQYNTCGRLSWRDLLEEARDFTPPPRIVVTDPRPDEAMWAEVLNMGAHDFLVQPFEAQEVFHVLASAWLSWSGERSHRRLSTAARA